MSTFPNISYALATSRLDRCGKLPPNPPMEAGAVPCGAW